MKPTRSPLGAVVLTIGLLASFMATLLRDLARQAGVHIYNDQNDVVMAGNGFLALHASSAGEKVLRLPEKCGLVDVLTGETFDTGRTFRFNMQLGDTKLLQIQTGITKL